jgi:hypothetical protein
MQRLFGALHGTLGSYLRDALQEGNDDIVACLHVPRALVVSCVLLFVWWSSPLLFIVKDFLEFIHLVAYSHVKKVECV